MLSLGASRSGQRGGSNLVLRLLVASRRAGLWRLPEEDLYRRILVRAHGSAGRARAQRALDKSGQGASDTRETRRSGAAFVLRAAGGAAFGPGASAAVYRFCLQRGVRMHVVGRGAVPKIPMALAQGFADAHPAAAVRAATRGKLGHEARPAPSRLQQRRLV